MQEVTLVLESKVVDGAKDRWKVMNASSDLAHRIDVEPDSGGLPYTSVEYILAVTGEELEGKVIITRREGAYWQIFRILGVGDNRLAIYPVDPRGTQYTGGNYLKGWDWRGSIVFRRMNDSEEATPFALDLDAWAVPEALQKGWTPIVYWAEVHRVAGIPVPKMPIDMGQVGEKLKICWQMIADKERISELEAGVARAEKILFSIMGDEPNDPDHSGTLLAQKMAGGNAGVDATLWIERLHDLGDALGIDLKRPGVVRRHERKPRRAR